MRGSSWSSSRASGFGQRPGVLSFRGQIDEVSLYNRALTVAEIQAIHAAGGAGKCAGFSLRDPWRLGLTMNFHYATRPDSYYVHYSGQDVADITQPFEIRLGSGSEAIVSFTSATDRGFYRVAEVPLNRPLDVDQDGIDDLCELQRPAILNPLLGGDARQDADGDGDSNLQKYACGSDPTNHFDAPSSQRSQISNANRG
jgi:hypothetical protein